MALRTINPTPQSQAVDAGHTVSFSVPNAGGSTTYQWQKDGVNIPNATGSNYSIANAQPQNIGYYTCKVTDSVGTITSQQATLNINGVPFGVWQGLVAYYPLDGTANDFTLNANDGVMVGSVTPTIDHFGNSGGACAFDGATTTIAAANENFAKAASNFSVSFWFKANGTEALGSETTSGTSYSHSYVIGGMHGGNNSGISVAAGTNGISVLEHGNGFLPVVLSYPASLGNGWVLATLTCSNNQAPVLYVNGNLARTGLNTGRVKTASAFAGDNYQGIGGGGYGRFNGSIDDVRIYNRALSTTEVQQLYAIENNTPPSTWTLFSAAESGLAEADTGLVNLSPIDQFSVVTGAASHSGGNALKLQAVNDGSTYAERTVVGPAVVSFSWRVSSEQDFDLFQYSVDGGVRETISGEGAWLNRSLSLGAGTHTLRWTYSKDVADSNFDDAGYLDDLVILEAYTNLEVSASGTAITGSSSLDFGAVQKDAAEATLSLTLKNTGTISQSVAATLPVDGGFVFSSGLYTASLTLSAGQSSTLSLKMPTAVAGYKSALLGITATGSRTAAPAITLSGQVQAKAPHIVCSWSGGGITSGQSEAIPFGATPRDLTFTVNNTGEAVMNLASLSVSPTGDFQVISPPASTVAINGSTTFTLRALDANRGNHQATVTIANNDADTPYFTFPVSSKSYLAVEGTGFVDGSFTNSGTTAAWDLATTTLASGSSGQAIKTGSTPNNGDSTIGATFEGPGLLSWNWKVSAQQGFDWLLCEVNGAEVAGISTKTAAWQSQVVQIPAGAQVRWIYRKDAINSAGSDTGYLSDIRFSKFAAAQHSFNDWSAEHGDLSPTQSISVGGMQGMFAWLGGVDPATGPGAGQYLPSVSGGLYKYRYTVAKAAAGKVQPQISTDLVTWSSRRMKQTLISEDEASAVVELSVAATGRVFSRLATELPEFADPVPAGFVAVTAGSLPSSSEMGAQSVATFYMAQTETTWGQWQTVRAWAVAHGYDLGDVGAGSGDSFPVTNVNWYQVVKWCNARSEMEGLVPVYTVDGSIYRSGDAAPAVNTSANGYRLPSAAEWEFAARGGVNTHGHEYSGSNDLNSVAWYFSNSGYTIHEVATKASNELGLSDMSGNVWEWCYDTIYGSNRVIRGGGWNFDAYGCSVAYPGLNSSPFNSRNYFGFRVARSSVP